MLPSIQHYLDACSRAIREVVRPALNPSDGFAKDQLDLVEGVLGIIGQHWSRVYELEVIELRELSYLATRLMACSASHAIAPLPPELAVLVSRAGEDIRQTSNVER